MSRVKVDVELNQSKFQSGMEQMNKSLEGIKKLGEATFVAFAIEKAGEVLADVVNKTLEYADAIDKTSIRMGISTDEVQALGIAAKDAGSKLETIEEAYRKIQVAKQKALAGDKEAMAGLKGLGVSDSELHGKNDLDILGTIASGAQHGGDKAQLELSKLGLKGAAGDLAAVGDKIKDLHKNIEDLKAEGRIMSQEDIDKINEAKDEFEAIEQQLAVQLAPVVAEAMKDILTGIILIKDYFGDLFQVIEKMAKDT
jgi:hypothetical protein